jgi:hypothetical protein
MPEALNQEQIALLWKAAQCPLISPEQRLSLSIANPYTMQGRVAEILQGEVAKLDPAQARKWAEESGTSMSLAAAAAQQGLAELTPQLQREIDRLQPLTEEEATAAEVQRILAAGNPYATATRNITNAIRLSELLPVAELEELKAAAPAAAPFGDSAEMAAARAASISLRPSGKPNHRPPIN